ncbi:MAG TPA: hypothetical protein VMU32_04475 [Solirubrobacteraceae bacterium]|nr:hypothetical protein [Solirubrobacteraceae bacterium]
MKAVNLIPSEQRSEGGLATRSGGAAYAVLVLIGGAAVMAALYGSASHTVESRRGEVAAIEAHTREVQQQASRLSPYTSFIQLREQRVQAVAELVGSRFDWPAAMGELSRVLPSDVALTSVNGAIATSATSTLGSGKAPASGASASSGSSAASGASAAAVSSATPPGAVPTFTIAGCATSQSVVAATLVRLRLIAGVKSVELQSSAKSGSSGGGGASAGAGGCSASDPVFTAQVAFEPLPAAPTLVETPTSGSGGTKTSAGGTDASAGSTASASATTGAAR